MKEYRKNKNEYQADGQLYVAQIDRCVCLEKQNARYYLKCRIRERGDRCYYYDESRIFLEKEAGGKA